MDNIIYHNSQPVINTFSNNVKSGIINPLDRRTYKELININSRFRDNYTTTPASDFYFNIPETLDKVVSMKLHKVIIPKFIYTVNSNTGSDNFELFFKADPGGTAPPGYNNVDLTTSITIPSGSYSGQAITQVINSKFDIIFNEDPSNNWPIQHVRSRYDLINGKISFDISWVDISNIEYIDFNFTYVDPIANKNFCKNAEIYSQTGSNIYKDQLTLGWLLGFRGDYKYNTPKTSVVSSEVNKFLTTGNSNISRKELKNLHTVRPRRARETVVKNNGLTYLEPTYNCCDTGFVSYPNPYDISFNYRLTIPSDISSPPSVVGWSYCAESIYDPLGNRYFLLSVNDFQNHHNRSLISAMQEETLNDGHLLAKIYGACGGDCCCENQERIYFGPTSISRLHIKLLDEFGRIVDLNNGDYSFTLELEILYDL